MIAWGWLILALVVGFLAGALLVRYKSNKDMEILADQIEDIKKRAKDLEGRFNVSKTGSS